MKTYMTRLFSVLMLAMFSMGAWADVKIFYGEKGEELKNGETKIKADNGTIAIEQKASSDGSQTTVNLTFTPNSGYTISTDNIEVYAVISPNSGSTRAPEISGDPLKLSEESSKDPEKRYSVKVDSKLGLWIKNAEFVNESKGNRNITYTYYALHNKDKGYLKQYKGIVGNDATFRHLTHDDNGSSMWVYSSDGYLQQEMYYLNVLNGQTLVLSTTPVTKWDLVTDGDKNRFQMNGSTKILGFDGSKVVLAENPTYKYAACTLTVTENNSKWEGPKDVSWEVQSPQLVTYLRTYYLRNITVKIDKNDAGTENVQVANGDSRCYCSLTYSTTSDANKGTKWDINETTGVIRNISTDNKQQSVTATYTLTPLNPIVLKDHPATTAAVTIKVNAKALVPDGNKKYLLFNTQDNNYRFPKATSSLFEGDLLPVNGKQSDLTETVNGDITWIIETDAEGFCLFKNVTTNTYLYYDAADYTVSDYGAVKMGSATPGSDTRYKFRLYSGCGNRDPFGGCYYIIPYEKQFAVWKKDGVLGELYFTLYMNTSNSTKIASIYKTSDNAKWKIYSYEWQNRLWSDYTINGDKDIYTSGDHVYTATTWISRNIKDSPSNTDYCTLPNSKTKTGITYTWQLTGLDGYVTTPDDVEADGISTLTANVTLPPSTRSGTLKVTATISSPFSANNNTSIPITLYNLNPTLTEISNLSEITDANGLYKLTADNVYSSDNKPVDNFSGTLDGGGFTISGLTAPLFTTLDGGTVRNLNLDNVNVTSGDNEGNTGAIACVAQGAARIYNVGIKANNSSTVSGSGYTGGLVGKLDGEARVINCYSYANITGGTTVGGIVGYNNVATTSANLKTMVMNCMFYGNITGGTDKAPIYNGKNIVNKDANGVSNFNYFWGDANYVKNQQINTYNCALMAETRFLQRFEFFRHLLNSHRELAAWWATGSTANKDQMMKWVLEPSQIGSSTPYPILKTPGYYPSVVNIDAEHATTQAERNKGGLLGTLSVTINMGSGGEQFASPTGANITTPSLTLNITDKDPDHFNFNYAKVQLPYYNDVGTGNYTGNRVVTGWKITSITGGTQGSYTTGDDATANAEGEITAAPYNFADRQCTNKDLYEVSGRVFNQGAYWDVPEGVTAITIEPYWAKAAYLADANVDVVYDQVMNNAYNVPNVGGGQIYTNDKNYSIAGESQKVYTDIGNAANALGKHSDHSVYDYAIVLVGNYHKHNGISSGDASHFYTIMSADFDHDNEPDYSYILRYNNRTQTHPVRVDFLNLPGLGMAQKSTGSNGSYNFGIMQPIGWFESTNTSLFRVTQFEYDRSDRVAAPLILQGGVMEQWVSGQNNGVANKTTYYHVGGNVWFKEFHRGTHQDQSYTSKHPPVSVTGGDFDEFYLTGLYKADVANYSDNAECYISGGRFGIVAGAGQEGIGDASKNTGNITWQIDHADIDEFYGGGINKDMVGNITTVISNSHVGRFCGGPKFGDMPTGKAVITTATNCTFGTYFGAGYGGNAYSREAPTNRSSNLVNTDWNNWITANYKQEYKASFGGVSTQFNYQFLPLSSNTTNVARIFIEYVKFSLATCRAVTSKLTGCTVTGNFYGGGSLGKVDGNVNSTLKDCTINGSAFGAGYSASLPDVMVDAIGFEVEPYYYEQLGSYRAGVKYAENDLYKPVKYTWQQANTVNSTTGIDKVNHFLFTTEDLKTLGTVTGNVKLTIDGTTTVGGSVYGGGEESAVGGNTDVNVTGGTIGTKNEDGTYLGGAEYGNVYGGGKGKGDDKLAGLVKGNTNVTISGTPQIYHNIYGGGAYGSVGEFTYADNTYHTEHPEVPVGMPYARTSGGTCTVKIEGGTIGVNGKENGMVFGSSRGDVSAPGTDGVDPNDRMAWVYSTNVTIGDTGAETSPVIMGSVYGSGENGHTFQNTVVDIKKGTIGITDTNTDGGPRYPYRGNVYGGGCGTDVYYTSDEAGTTPVAENYEGTKYTWYNLNAGIVLGNTTVTIDGGHVVHSVYGGGAMGSVGTFTLDTDGTNIIPDGKPISCAANTGLCTITISGGTIGNGGASMKTQGGPDDFGHVFGAGRGETRDTTVYKNLPLVGYVNNTEVTIKGSAFITGSVYGGAENSHVLGNTDVTIAGGQIGCGEGQEAAYTEEDWANTSLAECAHWDYEGAYSPYDIYAGTQPSDALSGAANPATNGHTFYGNVFGGGSGYYPYAAGKWVRSAGLVEGDTKVTITGGHILSNVYGGNEHTDVYGSCTVTMSGGTVGVPMTYTDKRNHPVTGNLFGAGKGDKRVLFNTWTNVKETEVIVSGGTIYGSVFGGGEDGHVLGDAKTTIKETDPTNNPTIIGTLGTTGYDGNVFGGGRGSYTALTAGVVCGNTEVNIEGGLMMGSVYGGGRLASVGTHLVPPTASGSSDESHPYYGKLIPDGKRQIIGQEDVDASDITHGHTVIKITGGKIGYDKAVNLISSSFSTGDVFGACKGTTNGSFATQQSGYDPTTQAQAMLGVSKSSLVNLLGGIVGNSIYGGGELGNIGTAGSTETFFAKINLLGGQVKNVYGGGLGQKEVGSVKAAETLVMGDVKVNLNGLEKEDYDAGIHGSYVDELKTGTGENAPTDSYRVKDANKGCVVTGNIFGCNNLNGTPLGHAKVHVFATQNIGKDKTNEKSDDEYDVAAVYGGGNQADYKPTDTQQSTEVIIEGCDLSKIEYVYGGGNAAASPATSVLIMGSKHIKYIFGGGNGAGENNPGANVGYYTDKTEYKDSQGNYLGDGKALVKLMAGNVDYIYGGSNSVGDIRGGSSVTNIDNTNGPGCCDHLIYKDIYGGGKDADMSGPANIIFTCTNSTSWGNDIYPGAENANIGGDVTITITSGKFKRVFGGNKFTGKIHGSITINIEENGKCGTPVIIGELYGGGNKAPYSVYGYDDNGNMLTSGTQKYANPQINVRAFTSIGNIYGGGLGSGAVMYGSPTVNINEVGFDMTGDYKSNAYDGENVDVGQDEDAATVTLHRHTNGAMGVIDKIFGGGNAAKVEGNTTVNVGTTEYEYLLVTDELTVGTTDVSGYYTRTNTGTTVNPIFTYTKVADGTKAAAETNYYRQNAVKGADIRGNVYGGGNKAEVTGSTNVNIGRVAQ